MKPFFDKPISLDRQHYFLKAKFPQGKGYIKNGKLVWHCKLNVGVAHGQFKIKLIYDVKTSPQVFVIEPNLYEMTDGEVPPHIYIFNEKETKLCLFYPSSNEWTSSKYISDTIVPWASLWFVYFSGWMATGKWYGGGKHPESRESFERGKVL